MLVDARTAYDLEAPGGGWYPLSAVLLGVATLLNGDRAVARRVLEWAAHLGRTHDGYPAGFALAQLSLLAVDEDDWSVAESCAVEAADLMPIGPRAAHPFGSAVQVAQARVAAHRHDGQSARDSVAEALRLGVEAPPVAFPWLGAQLAIALGRILLDLDDYPTALDQMAQARRHLARLPTEGVLGRQMQRLARDLARYGDHLPNPQSMSLTTAEMRVLQLLPTHLTLGEIADALFISRNTVKTQVASMYAKLKSSTRAEAVRAAREQGLIS
jgi:LuxR family maltose regulon positive regulatory protein